MRKQVYVYVSVCVQWYALYLLLLGPARSLSSSSLAKSNLLYDGRVTAAERLPQRKSRGEKQQSPAHQQPAARETNTETWYTRTRTRTGPVTKSKKIYAGAHV